VKFSGNGTITGEGSFMTPAGTFEGKGMYEGMSVVFTSETAQKTNLTISSLVSEQAEGDALHILGNGIGSFVGAGEFQGEGTCRGNGTFTGSGTLKGEGTLVGKGTLKGKGTMDGSGTFEGTGDCEGVSVRYYES